MNKIRKLSFVILMLALIFIITNAAWASELTLVTNPSHINIGLSFNGADLKISGRAPQDSDIYIKLSSSSETVVSLKKKEKVGPLWINSENPDVKNMPRFFQIWSSAPLNRLTPELSKQIGIDPNFDAVKNGAKVVSRKNGQETVINGKSALQFVNGLVNIYSKDNLYSIKEGKLLINGGKYSAEVKLPPTMPISNLVVKIYAVRNGILLGSAENDVKVETVGIINWFRVNAALNGPTYGAIAAMVALICGLLIGQFFHLVSTLGARKRHHLEV